MSTSASTKYLPLFVSAFLFFSASLGFAKPGADVAIISEKNYQVEAFSNTEIVVELSVPGIVGELNVQLNVDKEILIHNMQSSLNFLLNENDSSVRIPLNIETTVAGQYYLMFNVMLEHENGMREGRSMGLAVKVGDAAQVSDLSETNQANEKVNPRKTIKSYPAVEKIY